MNKIGNIAKSLISGLADASLNCKAATRLQSEALDHKLALLQRIGLCIHLVLCKWCRRYGKQIRLLRVAARLCADDHFEVPAQVLPGAARKRIKHALEAGKK